MKLVYDRLARENYIYILKPPVHNKQNDLTRMIDDFVKSKHEDCFVVNDDGTMLDYKTYTKLKKAILKSYGDQLSCHWRSKRSIDLLGTAGLNVSKNEQKFVWMPGEVYKRASEIEQLDDVDVALIILRYHKDSADVFMNQPFKRRIESAIEWLKTVKAENEKIKEVFS